MSPSQTPLLQESSAGFRISYLGKELYGRQPQFDCISKVSNLQLLDETIYLICSPLLWYGVAELYAKLPERSLLVLLEVDPALREICDWQDLAADHQSNRLICVFESQPQQIISAISQFFSTNYRRIQSLSLNGGRLLYADAYKNIQTSLEKELRRFWRNRSTLLFMGRLWVRNLISNLGILHHASDISDFPKQRQLVICGAGPSLFDCLDWIRANQNQLLIVVVDTALPIMAASDIRIDLVVALEAQMANLQDFVSAWKTVKAIAFDIASSPLVQRHCPQAQPWIFSSKFAAGKHWQRLTDSNIAITSLPPLGSVGVTTLYLCQFLCSERLFISGLDFSFSPGLTHAKNSPSHLRFLTHSNRLQGSFGETSSLSEKIVSLPGINNRQVISDPILESYQASANEVISFLQTKGIEVFDLRSRGLPLVAQPWNLQDAPLQDLTIRESLSPRQCLAEPESTQGFLQNLLGDIDDCIATIGGLLQNQPFVLNASQSEQLLRQLQGLDFIFYDFPDRDWPSLAPQALVRAMINLDYFKHYIEERLNPPRS